VDLWERIRIDKVRRGGSYGDQVAELFDAVPQKLLDKLRRLAELERRQLVDVVAELIGAGIEAREARRDAAEDMGDRD